MHNNEFILFLRKATLLLVGFLPVLFWLSLVFSFDTPDAAAATIVSILIHEAGHLIAITLLGEGIYGLRGALSGLRIKTDRSSYGGEFIIYLGGPLANAAAALSAMLFLPADYAEMLIAVNTTTCISNLLPAEGYDGYGMLRCLLFRRGISYKRHLFLSAVSLFTVTFLCILSLYLMDRCGEGYWIFFVFFLSSLKKMENTLKEVKNEQ